MVTFRKKNTGTQNTKAVQDAHNVNSSITAKEVRVIDEDGSQLGIMTLRDAIAKAEDSDLDLVEVAPLAKPPVCRIMDYGKFRYKEQKKESEARKKRSEIETKELRLRYITDSGDLETKLKQAREFILAGNKVKFVMKFRGREIYYIDLGLEKFKEITTRLEDISAIDDTGPLTGKQIYIVLTPLKDIVSKHQKQKNQGSTKQKLPTKSSSDDDASNQDQINHDQENSSTSN